MSTTKTPIEWADRTWNPLRGCSRVSEGCRNCYAEKVSARFSDPGQPFHLFADRNKSGSKWTGKVELIKSALTEPLHWRKPARIFVNSMSDLFHESLPDRDLLRIFTVIGNTHIATGNEKTHIFQVLTKRPDRMRDFMSRLRWKTGLAVLDGQRPCIVNNMPYLPDFEPWKSISGGGNPPKDREPGWQPENLWLGVSVEDQPTADKRIRELLRTPAAKRFVSYEPALGPVDFDKCYFSHGGDGLCDHEGMGFDWLIAGGESGPDARPCDVGWIRSAVQQCKDSGVACFVKQMGTNPFFTEPAPKDGEWPYLSYVDNRFLVRLKDRKGGDMAEWPEDLRVREFPTV